MQRKGSALDSSRARHRVAHSTKSNGSGGCACETEGSSPYQSSYLALEVYVAIPFNPSLNLVPLPSGSKKT